MKPWKWLVFAAAAKVISLLRDRRERRNDDKREGSMGARGGEWLDTARARLVDLRRHVVDWLDKALGAAQEWVHRRRG